MKTVYKLSTLAAVMTAATSGLMADSVESFLDSNFAKLEEAVPGKFNLNIRNRYESFDLDTPTGTLPDGTEADRDGPSMRIRYGYTTPDFSGFTAMVEGETLTRIGGDHDDIHPLDDAGDGTDLNQLWVQYKNEDFGSAKVGRQIYALDDHRFIGHVGWRQNIQTFDAVTTDFSKIDNLSIKAFYLDAQNDVAGEYNKLDSVGGNISYGFSKAFKLTGFYYLIEGDDRNNANASNRSFGLRATGNFMIDEIPFAYSTSIAKQSEAGDSSLDYDAQYFAGDLSAKVAGITLGGGFEIMEAGFRTPLSTVHKFNGFADALLPTAGFTNGLEDKYIYAGYTIPVGNGINTKVIYHWFDTESGGNSALDGGTELDLVASYKLNEYATLLAKYGNYSEDGGVGTGGLGNGVGGFAGVFDKEMFTFELNFVY